MPSPVAQRGVSPMPWPHVVVSATPCSGPAATVGCWEPRPGLLAFCEDLVGRQTSGLEGDTAGAPDIVEHCAEVQLAARWAAGSPTARHGAVLRRGGEVLSLGMNRQLQLATGRRGGAVPLHVGQGRGHACRGRGASAAAHAQCSARQHQA